MSKSSQKKISAYQKGLEDGLLGKPMRRITHSQIKFYLSGYNVGKSTRANMPPPKMMLIQRVRFVAFGTAPNGDCYLTDRENAVNTNRPDYVRCHRCGWKVDLGMFFKI